MKFKPVAGEKIQLEHPQQKKMPAIDKTKYETMKAAVLAALEGKELTHIELYQAVCARLEGKFEGDIGWYEEGVKLDLEARSVIERTATKPQKYRLR